jgi:hypothetical protein
VAAGNNETIRGELADMAVEKWGEYAARWLPKSHRSLANSPGFRDQNVRCRSHDRYDRLPKMPPTGFFSGGWSAMNMGNDFGRLIASLMIAATACGLQAAGFDGYVVPTGGVPHESVLIHSPEMADGEVVISDADVGSIGWSADGLTCCDTPGCSGGCSTCNSDEGWINRIFGRCHDNCHYWTAQIDALMLWQGNIPSRPLLQSGGVTALDANQAQTQMGAGPRFGLFYNLDPCHAIEGNYFWVNGFDGEVTLPGGTYTAVTMPDPPVPSSTDAINGATLLTNGEFKSAEINWRWRNNEVLTWLLGFRWVEWNQAAQLSGSSIQPAGSFVVDSATGNDLYGSQIGADLLFWNAGGRFRLNGIGKAGIYGNHAYQRASGTLNGVSYGPQTVVGNQVAFFGEVGMYGDIAINRWLSWRTGYVLFWGSGLALPTENLSLVNFPPNYRLINITESLLVHGVTTGLEARW